jgi:D-glycero-alpha-D-manno-heptose 1-phosphate guanylyltransferase
MAPVAGRPFLEILLSALAQKGFRRVVFSLGHMADIVVGHFGNSFVGIELVYEIEDSPLGTGGAIRAAMAHCRSDHVFVFNGDTFLDLEADQVEAQWQAARRPIIVAREVPDTSRYGRMQVEDGRVSGFLEKGVGGEGLINAGCYVFPRTLLDCFETGQAFSLETAFLAPMAAEKCFDVFVTHGHFIDIGIPEDYARAQTELAGAA